jgi:8-oxo-dGTP pyrophosphatase MutT (NUDIX family)
MEGPHPSEEWNAGEVTEPRQAASIVVLRDSDEGPEVLLVQRNPEQRFMGGAWVFPGGAVHDEDADHAAAAVRELEEEAGVTLPRGHPVVPWSRWITPAEVVVRFDTWFFVAEAPPGVEPAVDGGECVDELMLVFPTIKHLEALAGMGSVAEAMDNARSREVVPVQPRVVIRNGTAEVLLPGEPGYDQA